MLWLIIFLLWSLRTAIAGHAAGGPAMRVLLWLLVVLGALQAIVSVIEIIEFVISMS